MYVYVGKNVVYVEFVTIQFQASTWGSWSVSPWVRENLPYPYSITLSPSEFYLILSTSVIHSTVLFKSLQRLSIGNKPS